ncbi:MAG: efflux RND transporter periplasmic adaptor subunit [Acidobacteria bacterium]|nr:efflux RND transporter periplasmic adaptor subunit [Acidobacteriota bacterium]
MTENDENELVPVEEGTPVLVEEDEPPRSKVWIGVIIAAVVLVLALIVYFVWIRKSTTADTAETKPEAVVSVKVAKAEKGDIAAESTAVGTVTPSKESTVAASISAQIVQMPLLKNNFVKQGDVVATLASQDLVAQRDEAAANLREAQLGLQTITNVNIPQATAQSEKDIADAKANLDNVQATYERRKVLYQKGGISLKDLEASQLAVQNADNALRLAQKNATINRTGVNPNSQSIAAAKIKQSQDRLNALEVQVARGQVRAPISGTVTDQFQFQGEFAQQGGKLLTIADLSTVIVKAQFADTVVKDLKAGDEVKIVPPGSPDEPMTGSVTLVSRSADPQSRTAEVWATFGNPRGLLIANGTVPFIVTTESKDDAIVVPSSAVTLETPDGEDGTVMVAGLDGLAHETKVKVGIRQDDKIEITDGLKGGESVIIEGNYALPDGTHIEIAEDKPDDNGGDDK